VDFNITVLETTAPANFTVNVSISWNNTNQAPGYNATSMNVTVEPTYILDVLEDNITGTVAAGIKKNIENITVRSFGNAELVSVEFNVTGFASEFNFTFEPENFSTLGAGNSTQVRMFLETVSGYPSGDYGGLLNITSGNNGYEELTVNITVSGTNMSLNVSPLNFTAQYINYYIGQNFTLDVNTTNTDNATAYNVNITLNFSAWYIYTSNTTPYLCGNKASLEYCYGSFQIIISNGTPSGNYSINVSVEWDNPELGILSNWTLVNITVFSNVTLIIPEDKLKGNITHGTTSILGNFTMNSTGNDPVEDMEFIIEDPSSELKDFNITVIPNVTETGGSLPAGSALVVNVSVGVPLSYPPGIYEGFLNVTTSNTGYKNLSLNITVPVSRTWLGTDTYEDSADLFCMHSESPVEGVVCNLTINNTGNVNITFNITPQTSAVSMNNYTWTEAVNFSVENQTTYNFSVFYNVTGAQVQFYYSNYTISGVGASPLSRNLTIWLSPFVEPLIEFNVTPSIIAQSGVTEIKARITDQSGVGINFTYVNVTRPDNTTDSIMMRFDYKVGDLWFYEEFYPDDPFNGTWGNSTLRGNYTVVVYSQDVLTLNDTANGSFYAYAVMVIDLRTTRVSGEYYQGETGSITYKVRDLYGYDMPDVNVSITIKDPTNRSLNLGNGNFVTNSQGEPSVWPSFGLLSDSPTGIYNITAFSEYNDTPINYIINNETGANFTVMVMSPGIITLDLEAPAETSISDGLEVVAMLTDGVSNVDADSILVSLYDPLNNLILDNQSMTRLSTGRYLRWYNTSISSNQGNWRWMVTATKSGGTMTKDVYTRLVGGPFDVRNITVTDDTVPNLGISVIIENTGGVSQDAFVQWNLTRTDTGEMLREGLDTVLINANSEYTYTATPTGVSYIGEVRILFVVTYSGTERAGAYEIFDTKEEEGEPEPPGPPRRDEGPEAPSGGIGVGPPPTPEIEIVVYPAEISTEVGWAQYPSVTVNNTGNMMLRNIMLTIEGIPSSWYTIQPLMLPLLKAGESKTFVVNLLVPAGTEAKQYYGIFNATSNETYDEKLTSVIVFGSREELVRYQLKKLKEELEEFKEDVNATAKECKKDLTKVYYIIE